MISHTMTLANSIIGVSVLAMPYCFKQCGIILSILVLLISSALSRLACHFLIKSSVMCRRRNFEFLAFHTFGSMGKFLVELCIIGFLLGTCIAYYVVVGDLGPQIIGEFINQEPKDIRTTLLVTTAVFIVLPLGLLRNVSSLSCFSTASIAFYVCLVLKVVSDSMNNIFSNDCVEKINFWRPAGMLQCLPIFALGLFCQTQLFEIYETMPNATLEKMNQVVRGALNICTILYISVGLFGYIGFCTQSFSGNILISFEPSVTSEIIKIGFVLSVAFSFPLVIFPCRASLNSLLFRRGYTHLESSISYISETKFRCLTTFIVMISMLVGIMIPNIEFVLGIIGSTIGVFICLIFPAMFFITISTKNTNERLLAQILVVIGMLIMILGTYANLYAMENSSEQQVQVQNSKLLASQIINGLSNEEIFAEQNQLKQPDNVLNENENVDKPKVPDKAPIDENDTRQKPALVPLEKLPISMQIKKEEPVLDSLVTMSNKVKEIINNIDDDRLIEKTKKAFDSLKKIKPNLEDKILNKVENPIPDKQIINKSYDQKIDLSQKNDIAIDAIKKEDIELAAAKEISNIESVKRLEQLDKTIVKHLEQQKEMIKEQKELLKDIIDVKKEIVKVDKENVIGEKVQLNNESVSIVNKTVVEENYEKKSKIIKLPDLISNRDPVVKVSTKNNNNQSNHIPNDFKNRQDKIVIDKIEKSPEKQDTIKNKENSIPFVLKVNSKNKDIVDEESSKIKKIDHDAVPVHRSILQSQDRRRRDKREIEDDVVATTEEKKKSCVKDELPTNMIDVVMSSALLIEKKVTKS